MMTEIRRGPARWQVFTNPRGGVTMTVSDAEGRDTFLLPETQARQLIEDLQAALERTTT